MSCRSCCSFMDPHLPICGRILKGGLARRGWGTGRCSNASTLLPRSSTILWPFKGGWRRMSASWRFWMTSNAVGDRPEGSGAAYTAIQEELRTHTGIEVHQGKTQLWNRVGVAPAGSAALTVAVRHRVAWGSTPPS